MVSRLRRGADQAVTAMHLGTEQAGLSVTEAKRIALEREGAEFHQRRATGRSSPESSQSQPRADDAGSESGYDMDSNQANVSDDGERSIREDENLD